MTGRRYAVKVERLDEPDAPVFVATIDGDEVARTPSARFLVHILGACFRHYGVGGANTAAELAGVARACGVAETELKESSREFR